MSLWSLSLRFQMPSSLIRKVDVVWGGLAGSPYFTQFYFGHEAGSASSTATAVRTFLQALASNLAAGMTATVKPEQAVIDTSSNQIVSVETAGAVSNVAYIGTGDPLPFATQVLLKLSTSQFNGGRRLRGRINIPGNLEAVCQAGALAPSSVGTYNGPAATLISATSSTGKWAVWSRMHHSWASVDSATAWDQFAVLKTRRP